MKRILLFLFVLVLIVGCAQEVVEPERTTTTQKTEQTQEQEQEQEQEQVLTIDPDLKSEIEEVLEGGKYIYTTKIFKKLKVGEGNVFGLGIANYKYMVGAIYTVEVKFVEARDSSNNIIELDKTVMESWLEKYKIVNITLAAGEYRVVSIPIVVKGLIKEDKETVPGSYYFDARVFYHPGNFKDQEGATKRFTVLVIE